MVITLITSLTLWGDSEIHGKGGIGKHTSSGGDGAMQSIRKGLKNEQKKGGAVKCTRKRVTKKHTRKG